MNIQKSTQVYETWLGERTTLVKADLDFKHVQMAAGVFPFLRSTFYRWAQVFPEICPALAKAPVLLAVGDLHIENFGTWRDKEGRLVWGINDFDEAHQMPYAIDLVRLAVSASLAGTLISQADAACEAILGGYEAGLKAGGKPFVLAEDHGWLRTVADKNLVNPSEFWKKMAALPSAEKDVPLSAREGIEHELPAPRPAYHAVSRRAGLGSLGHQRFVGVAEWQGGGIAREAKALVPSAWLWAVKQQGPLEILYQAVLTQSVRDLDPYVALRGKWILRRLAPDCTRVPLESLADEKEELRLLRAMGWETANVHLGSPNIKEVLRHLDKQPKKWLLHALEAMTEATKQDYQAWSKEWSKAKSAKNPS
jgi:aminoglycoside/choline kinase family phosphotransferase